MNRNVLFFGLASVTALLGTVTACSSTTTTETVIDGGSAATDGGATTGKDAGKDSGTTDTDSGATGDPDEACAKETTLQACGTCCVTNHPSGYKVFQDSLFACACAGTGADGGAPCAADCAATACKATPAQPDQTCNTCLQTSVGQTGACNVAVSADCSGSPDCLAQQKCITPCQGKP